MSNVSMIDGHIDEPKGMSDDEIRYLLKKYSNDECIGKLLRECLDLINKLKEDNRMLNMAYDIAQAEIAELKLRIGR